MASGVHGHSSPVSMYSMNWVTDSFMRVETLWGGGGFVATAHVMQWCRQPPCRLSPPFQIRGLVVGDDVVQGTGQGVVPRGSAEKRTSSGGSIGLTIQTSIIPSDGRPGKLDALSGGQSLSYWGPREFYSTGVPLGTGVEKLATHAPKRWDTFSFNEEVAEDVRLHG